MQLALVFLFVERHAVALGFFLCLALGFGSFVLLLRLHGKLACVDFVFRHRHFPAEAYAITLVEENLLVVVAVPVVAQKGGNFVLFERGVELFGMRDVIVVGDAAVLAYFLMVGISQQVGLVAVAEIRTVKGVVEVGCVLVGIIAAPVDVVDFHAQSEFLARIHGKERLEMVFAILSVAASVIREIGDGRQRVGEMKFARLGNEEVVRRSKEEVRRLRAVDIDTVDAG